MKKTRNITKTQIIEISKELEKKIEEEEKSIIKRLLLQNLRKHELGHASAGADNDDVIYISTRIDKWFIVPYDNEKGYIIQDISDMTVKINDNGDEISYKDLYKKGELKGEHYGYVNSENSSKVYRLIEKMVKGGPQASRSYKTTLFNKISPLRLLWILTYPLPSDVAPIRKFWLPMLGYFNETSDAGLILQLNKKDEGGIAKATKINQRFELVLNGKAKEHNTDIFHMKMREKIIKEEDNRTGEINNSGNI